METNGTNGASSAGRFLRIEQKLDTLIDNSNGFQMDVVQRLTRLETTTAEARTKLEDAASAARSELEVSATEARGKMQDATSLARAEVTDRESNRSFSWMKIGILASIAFSLTALILRLLGVG